MFISKHCPYFQKWLGAKPVKFHGIVPAGTGQLVNQSTILRGELEYGKSNAQSGVKPVLIKWSKRNAAKWFLRCNLPLRSGQCWSRVICPPECGE